MTPDYSTYTIAELQESLRVVDGRRYPENEAAIEAELQARVESGEFEREMAALKEAEKHKAASKRAFAQKASVLIAWYLILSPIVLLSYLNFESRLEATWPQIMLLVAFAVFLAASHWAGRGLLKGRSRAQPVAIVVLALQLLRVTSETVYFQILSFAGFYLTFADGATIGLRAWLQPGLQVSWGQPMPFEIGINLLAALMIYYLVAANRDVE